MVQFADDLDAELADAPPTHVIVGSDGCVVVVGTHDDCRGSLAGMEECSPDMIEERELRIVAAPWPGVAVGDVVRSLARPVGFVAPSFAEHAAAVTQDVEGRLGRNRLQ